MEIEGFTRIIWKIGEVNINDRLLNVSRLFYNCEYRTVLEGQRKACTDHMSLETMPGLVDKIQRDGLLFTPLRRSGFYQGFAHQHKQVEPGKPYYWFGCITKTVEDGEKFKQADQEGDHLTMGKMLGYPECCSEYFKESFPKNYDPVWLKDDDIPDGPPEVNILLRYFGVRIVSHLSCSAYCEGTLSVAKERLKIMKKIDQETTEWLLDYLSKPMTWNSYHGVVEVDTPNFLGITHSYPLIEEPRLIRWRLM